MIFAFQILYLYLTLAHSKGPSQGREHFDWISRKRWQIWPILLFPISRKLLSSLRLVFLHLTMRSRSCTFWLLISCRRWQIGKTLLMPSNGNAILAFHWHNDGWLWRILTVNVNRNSIVKIRKLNCDAFRRMQLYIYNSIYIYT